MAGIANLSVVDDAAGSAFGSGHMAFTADANYLVSVIATNPTDNGGSIYVYVVPAGTENTQEEWALIAHALPLPAHNSYETFRFGVNTTDAIYVAGSAGVRYFVQGINQS